MPATRNPPDQWPAQDKLAIVCESYQFKGPELSEYCRKKGLYPEQVAAWEEAALSGYQRQEQLVKQQREQAKADQQTILQLQAELRRKEAALAETAALLVLSKKSQAIWGGQRGKLIPSADRQMAIDLIKEAVTAGARQAKACEVLGISPRTVQRWQKNGLVDQRTQRDFVPPNKLTDEERRQILEIANSEEFQSQSPKQIVPTLADRGRYVASESSFYRVLREADMMHHRGKSAVPTKEKPQGYQATGSNQVWSWDITYCATTIKGIFYYLYLVMDVYSRKIVGWSVHEEQSSEWASVLAEAAYQAEGVQKGQVVLHSDNGSPMKGASLLATLQKLGVIPSFSRPSVSDDNAFSEALFKTLKYHPTYPSKPFESLESLEAWVERFVDRYNNVHKHSGIGYVTPIQRHTGQDIAILGNRTAVYQAAKAQNPNRWSGEIRDWTHQKEVWLNPSHRAKNNETTPVNKAA